MLFVARVTTPRGVVGSTQGKVMDASLKWVKVLIQMANGPIVETK